jgi:hypothetical protein
MSKTQNVMKDAAGNEIPARYVKPIDRERDRLVQRLAKEAMVLNQKLAAFKVKCLDEIKHFQADAEFTYGVSIGGEKNGLLLSSFDGTLRIERRASETLTFDERLLAAQTIINQWLAERTSGVDHDLVELINKAFRGRNNSLRFGEIVRLTRLNIKGEQWAKAMELIRESITVQSSKTHCRFYRRADAKSDYKLIPLDIAAV